MPVTEAILFLLALWSAGEARAQNVPVYTVHVQHPGRSVEVRINDVPVAAADPRFPSLTTQVSSFLRNGTNRIELRSSRHGQVTGPLTFALRRRAAGQQSVDFATLPEPADEPIGEQLVRRLEVEVPMPVTWSWERAVAVTTLGPDDRRAIRVEVVALHADLTAGNAAAVVDRFALMLRETALLRSGVLERVREQYRTVMAGPGWSVAPLDTAALDITPFGSLVRVSTAGNLVESREAEDERKRILIPSLYFAKLDGEWVIVRRGP